MVDSPYTRCRKQPIAGLTLSTWRFGVTLHTSIVHDASGRELLDTPRGGRRYEKVPDFVERAEKHLKKFDWTITDDQFTALPRCEVERRHKAVIAVVMHGEQ